MHSEHDPTHVLPIPGVPANTSQQYDPWAGQHVPSQGFSPGPNPLHRSFVAETLDSPGYPQGQAPAAPMTSAAALPFPSAMSSPFAQTGYPPYSSSDPWAAEPEYPTSSSQPVNPWAPGTVQPVPNPWDSAAPSPNPWDQGMHVASPWDARAARQTPAAAQGGEYGAQDSGYRSTDGRPAVALMVFGFAGKIYCWRPAASSSGKGCLHLIFKHG